MTNHTKFVGSEQGEEVYCCEEEAMVENYKSKGKTKELCEYREFQKAEEKNNIALRQVWMYGAVLRCGNDTIPRQERNGVARLEATADRDFSRAREIVEDHTRRMNQYLAYLVSKFKQSTLHQFRCRVQHVSSFRRGPRTSTHRTVRASLASSSRRSDDSGGSEPPQGDPDLPSFRFVRSGLTHSYLKSDRFIPSWRPGRLGPMSHALLRGWSR